MEPSPKFHNHDEEPVERLVKLTSDGAQTVSDGDIKSATGASTTTGAGYTAVVVHPESITQVSEMVYDPVAVYACEGFCCVLVVPSPKSHRYETAGCVVEKSTGEFKQA